MNKELNKLLMQLVDLHPKYIDLSLDRLNNLLEKLKNPHLKIPPVIHIAGTNGKGSVLSFLKEILIENNFKVSAYISPHLKNFNENKTPDYHSLFIRYEKRYSLKKSNLILFFEIWNTYNRENIETFFYSRDRQSIEKTVYFSTIPVGGFGIEF